MGVIGTVKNVSENFCSVMSVLHEKNAVSAKIKKSGYIGSLVWELGGYRIAQLKDIPNHVKLNVGDEIITTGYSMVYPEGIMIGKVVDFDLPEGNNFYNIDIELSVDYKSLSHVFIIKSWMKDEQKELEALQSLVNDKKIVVDDLKALNHTSKRQIEINMYKTAKMRDTNKVLMIILLVVSVKEIFPIAFPTPLFLS